MTLNLVLEKLKTIAAFTPEFEADEVSAAINESYHNLVEAHPALRNYSTYLEFLQLTGGAHIHNTDFSLGIYGFGGYIVTSFDEGLFLDSERYFQFAEVLYPLHSNKEFVFAFDFKLKHDLIYISPLEHSNYILCSISFLELLTNFADGIYLGLKP